jgi:hypothetical protein
MKTTRLIIFAKDIQRITGKGERHSSDLIRKIKETHGKASHHFLTIDEFCSYTGLDREKIMEVMEA